MEKTCPRCEKPHSKPGKYCSYSCANVRHWTDSQKKVFSQRQKEYMAKDSDEVELHKWKLANNVSIVIDKKFNRFNEEEDTKEEYFLMPELNDVDDSSEFVQNGDIWSVSNDF